MASFLHNFWSAINHVAKCYPIDVNRKRETDTVNDCPQDPRVMNVRECAAKNN